jgi:hypothetical protein
MTIEEFEKVLGGLIHQQPFQPFVVEKTDGTQIVVGTPGVAFNNGGACYLSPEEGLLEFAVENVRGFRLAASEPVA